MGRKLSESRIDPRPVAIPIAGGELVTGIEWWTADAAILFLHDSHDELGLDSWGAWPDRFAGLGYAVLVIDLPPGHAQEAARSALEYIAAKGAPRRFVIAAGDTVGLLDEQSGDAFVLIAPGPSAIDPGSLGFTPKLIVAGSGDLDAYEPVEAFARNCRGWSLLSTFAVENSVPALMNYRHAQQIGSQIAGFLQEYRAPTSTGISRIGRRTPR